MDARARLRAIRRAHYRCQHRRPGAPVCGAPASLAVDDLGGGALAVCSEHRDWHA